MTAHTPGPWEVARRARARAHIRAVAGDDIAQVYLVDYGRREPNPERDANACLIAAAPDLLEALRDVLPDLQHYASTHGPGPDRRLDAARAAIARAEGRV